MHRHPFHCIPLTLFTPTSNVAFLVFPILSTTSFSHSLLLSSADTALPAAAAAFAPYRTPTTGSPTPCALRTYTIHRLSCIGAAERPSTCASFPQLCNNKSILVCLLLATSLLNRLSGIETTPI